MKGGNLSNLKNILVMRAGPIGLINTLALLTRYPYNNANDFLGQYYIFCPRTMKNGDIKKNILNI